MLNKSSNSPSPLVQPLAAWLFIQGRQSGHIYGTETAMQPRQNKQVTVTPNLVYYSRIMKNRTSPVPPVHISSKEFYKCLLSLLRLPPLGCQTKCLRLSASLNPHLAGQVPGRDRLSLALCKFVWSCRSCFLLLTPV